MPWWKRLLSVFVEWLAQLFEGRGVGVNQRGALVVVPEIPVIEGVPEALASLPKVELSPPPAEYFAEISKAIDAFAAATLQPGDRGGIIGIATTKGINLAVVQKIGKKTDIVGYVGKTWGAPIEGGLMWRTRW